ncbi:hypothetical protein RI367_004725 [Sorochytrium milnesiophthora]
MTTTTNTSAAGTMRRLQPTECDAAVMAAVKETIYAAMGTDPIANFYTPTDTNRFCEASWVVYLRAFSQQPVLATNDDHSALCIVTEYPEHKLDTIRLIAHGGLSLMPVTRVTKWLRLVKLSDSIDSNKAKMFKEHGPFVYIALLATHPTRQGQGLGSSHLRQVTGDADKRGVWCYLEASTARNRALYLRHGFVDIKTLQFGDTPEQSLWLMKRAPVS